MNFQSVRMNQDGSDQQGVEKGSGASGQLSKSSTAAIPNTASESDNVLGSSLTENGGKGDLPCQLDLASTRNGHRVNGCHTAPTPPPLLPTSNSNMSNAFSIVASGSALTPVAEGGSSCNASHSSETESELKKKSSVKKDRKALRKGKWTVEEEEYTSRIIHFFSTGIITLPEGSTLRSYLAERLNCDPMRITKKFAGASCLGRRVYHLCDSAPPTTADVERAKMELAQLERRFRLRVDHGQSGIPLPTASDVMMTTTTTTTPSLSASSNMMGGTNNDHNMFLHPSSVGMMAAAAAAANGANNLWQNVLASVPSANAPASFFFPQQQQQPQQQPPPPPPSSQGPPMMPNAAAASAVAALGAAWPSNPLQQPLQQQQQQQQQHPLWLVPTPAPAPVSLMPAPPAPASAPIAAPSAIPNRDPSQQASDTIMAWAWNQAAATLSPLLQQLAVANLQQHQQQLKQAFENQVKSQLPQAFDSHQVKAPPQQQQQEQVPPPPPLPPVVVAAPLPPPAPAAAPPPRPQAQSPHAPTSTFTTQMSAQEQLKLAFEAHLRNLSHCDVPVPARVEQRTPTAQMNAKPTQTIKQLEPPAPPQQATEVSVPMPPPLTVKKSIAVEERDECQSPYQGKDRASTTTPLTPRSKEDEAAGMMLLGFLSSLRKGYEDAVKNSTEDEGPESLKRQHSDSSEGVQPTPAEPIRRMLISDHSLSSSHKSAGRSGDQSSRQPLPTPLPLEPGNTQLSYLPMQMANGMRQMWPAPITDGSSSKATNDTNSSGESESSSDKGNPSSSEESDREPQNDRSLGPPRKRHKTKHAYGAFTRRNVKLHDSRSAAAAQLEDDNNNSMLVDASSEHPNGNVREGGPKKPPRM